jgi:hypothetical protein
MTRTLAALACAAAVALGAVARAGAPPDWNAVAGVETIQVKTHDDDEAKSPRDTTIWLAVHEGHGYIRTGGTRWGKNVLRDPDVVVEIEGVAYPLRATEIPAGATYDAVTQTFRDKYGFSDAALSLVRGIGGAPHIFRLDARR